MFKRNNSICKKNLDLNNQEENLIKENMIEISRVLMINPLLVLYQKLQNMEVI